MKKLTTEEFIDRAKCYHGDKYDYSKVEYVNNNTEVKIICQSHGVFSQRPSKHMIGQGCPVCKHSKIAQTNIKNALRLRFKNLIQPEDCKLIPLTKGKFAKVDNEDFDKLKNIVWGLVNNYSYNRKIGYMHRYVLNAPEGMFVDHINHDKLDNRRSNLRLATKSQNGVNTIRKQCFSSLYTGVSWNKNLGKWEAYINFENKRFRLGDFTDEEEAARAYDKKALNLHKEFAQLNFKN